MLGFIKPPPPLTRPLLTFFKPIPKPGIPGLIVTAGLLLLDLWLSMPPADAPSLAPPPPRHRPPNTNPTQIDAPHQPSPAQDNRPPSIDPTKLQPGIWYKNYVQATRWNGLVEGHNAAASSGGIKNHYSSFGPSTLTRVLRGATANTSAGLVPAFDVIPIESDGTNRAGTVALETEYSTEGFLNFQPFYKFGSYKVVEVERLDTGQRFTTNNPPLNNPYSLPQNKQLTPISPNPLVDPVTNNPPKEDRKVPGPLFPESPLPSPVNSGPSAPADSLSSDPNSQDSKTPTLGLGPPPVDPATKKYLKSPTQPTTTVPTAPKDIPLFPPFPIISPQNPTVKQPEEQKAPVYQTAPGNGCCVPTSTTQQLDAANKKLDALTPTLQSVDLTLLNTINSKLGNQLSGGLSGFLTDKFTKLWNSRVIDRTLNLLAVSASLHNAIMLSRDLGATLIETTGNILAAVGIKDADGQAFDFNTIIGETVENFVKSVVGAENYASLKQTWIKANRILTAGANLIDSVRSMQNTMIEAQEVVGGWVAKIGNGLSQDGVVNDDTIDWMPEKPDFKNPFFRAQQTIENLTEATESVNQLASAVIETQELSAQIASNYETFKGEIATKSDEKKGKEIAKTGESQSTDITNNDMKEGSESYGS